MKAVSFFLSAVLVCLAGCGGGGSSSGTGPAPAGAAGPGVGNITLLVGDNPLDNIEAVLIDIEEVRLLGGDDGQVTISDGPTGEFDLLSLRNITELVASTSVPADEYSKIRLIISSLRIQEKGDPLPPLVDVQLPANGKIDLNPQGEFEISPGESLVVQVDIDLARSIKVVQTGNSEYRFRPVVFVEILDEDLRLTKLFGELNEDDDGGADADGEPSDFDLCLPEVEGACVDLNVNSDTVFLFADGTPATGGDLVGSTVHAFGHFIVNDQGQQFFLADLLAEGDEDAVVSIDGDVVAVETDAFDLAEDDVTTTKVLTADALLFDAAGNPLLIDIAVGQEAEAWAQTAVLATADEGEFPAILVQITEVEADEESVEGELVDLQDNTLTVLDTDGVEQCVTVTDDTEIQLLSDYNDDAETDTISLVALGDFISVGVEVEAFGTRVGDCLEAELIAAEVE